jgi:hypothetical protein
MVYRKGDPMTKYHIRPRIMTTVAALTLVPALALAQAGSGSGTQGSQGSGTQGSQGSQGSGTQGSQGSQDDQGTQGSQGSQGSHSQGSHGQGAQGSQQGSQSGQSATGTGDTSGMMQSPSAGRSIDSTRASIDSSEVQRVFGMDAALVDINSLNSEDAKKLQQALKDRGHYQGQVDGVVGPQTRAALNAVVAQQFALTRRLINQGQITSQFAESMGLEDITPVTGVDTGSPSEQGQPGAPSPGQTPPSGSPPNVYPPQTDDSE